MGIIIFILAILLLALLALMRLIKLLSKKPWYKTISDGEKLPNNGWYRLKSWKRDTYFKWSGGWGEGWKGFSKQEEPVAGIYYNNGDSKILKLVEHPEFSVILEREPDNEHDKNAVKVLVSALVNERTKFEHIGYLAKDTAKQIRDEQEIAAIPYSITLSDSNSDYENFEFCIKLLVRSKAYLKLQSETIG